MVLRIADLYMEIAYEEPVTEKLANLKPFAVTKTKPDGQESICHICAEKPISCPMSSPTQTHSAEGKTLHLWVEPDYCTFSLIFHSSGRAYRLQADRRWKSVKTDLPLCGDEQIEALNDFIMIAFIYSSAFHNTVAVHSSCVATGMNGCAFIGPSGIGKSTHSNLWQRHFSGTRLINDDQPAIRILDNGMPYVYGTPWSGKTLCYRNDRAELNALFFMEQAHKNQLVRLSGIETFQRLLKATSLIGQDTASFDAISGTLAKIAGTVPAFLLKNRPDKEAAQLSHKAFVESINKQAP